MVAEVLTSLPVQPIQVNDMVFLHPDNADTSPPDDICVVVSH